MKEPLPIKIPEGATISNRLYAVMSPAELDQDICYIDLPNGYSIDIGWYPIHDLNGCFIVRALRGVKQVEVVTAGTRPDSLVVDVAEKMAARFSKF